MLSHEHTNDKKEKFPSRSSGESVNGLGRRSNQPQYSCKPKSNPELGPNFLQFCHAEGGKEVMK